MLTTAQESVLEQMIEAFQNGKRLTDLPEATGSNPFDLLVEVCENGESKKAYLASMLPYIEQQCAYGIEFDTEVSSPACTRIGSTDLHKSLPIQSRMKGVLLSDNGTINEYLSPQGWQDQVRDGSMGQVMVEIPQYWRKFLSIGTKRQVWMSEVPLPGYHLVPKMYVSAYEASLDHTNSKLASVANLTAQYRGGNNTSAWDDTYCSLLGRPATNISRTDFRTYARNRKSGSKQWNCWTYDAHKNLFWLFVVEYATLNSQAAYNAQLDANGYRQGGLGDGVTTWTSTAWGDFNSRNPFVPCGHTDSLGNGTGVVDYVVKDESDNTLLTVHVPRYRGIENPFGHVNKWTDGVNIQVTPTAGDNVSRVYVCSDPDKFTDSGYTDYTYVGNCPRESNYITKMLFGEGGEIIPSEAGGSSSTYFCDQFYTAIPNSTELRGVLFGGSAGSGAVAGLAGSHSYDVPSIAGALLGSRLCFLP